TTDLYYSDKWQVLEEKEGTLVRAQQVWSPLYVDALVLRDRDSNGDGSLEERLYVQQDANWNVTAVVGLVNSVWHVLEPYPHGPHGKFPDRDGGLTAVLDANWQTRGASAYAWLYLHQGGRYDTTSGLYHFRAREDSPTMGRWMQLDPIRYEAGDTNLYRYLG